MKARLSVYQDRCYRGKETTFSNHLLKYAARAKFFNPTIPEVEFLSVMRSHYPIEIQKAWITNQPRTISEAISFLREMDSLEQWRLPRESDSRTPPNNDRYHDSNRDRDGRGSSHQPRAVQTVQYQNDRGRPPYQTHYNHHQQYHYKNRHQYNRNQQTNQHNESGGACRNQSGDGRRPLDPHHSTQLTS